MKKNDAEDEAKLMNELYCTPLDLAMIPMSKLESGQWISDHWDYQWTDQILLYFVVSSQDAKDSIYMHQNEPINAASRAFLKCQYRCATQSSECIPQRATLLNSRAIPCPSGALVIVSSSSRATPWLPSRTQSSVSGLLTPPE